MTDLDTEMYDTDQINWKHKNTLQIVEGPAPFIHFSQESSCNKLMIIFPLDLWGHWSNERFNQLTKVNGSEQSGHASRLNYLASAGPII